MRNGNVLGSTPKASISHDQPVNKSFFRFFVNLISFLLLFSIFIFLLVESLSFNSHSLTLFFCKVLCSTWKDDGTTVFSGGCDKQVKMWPLLSGGQAMTVAMHDAPIKEVAWIPEMSLLVTGSWDKTLK